MPLERLRSLVERGELRLDPHRMRGLRNAYLKNFASDEATRGTFSTVLSLTGLTLSIDTAAGNRSLRRSQRSTASRVATTDDPAVARGQS